MIKTNILEQYKGPIPVIIRYEKRKKTVSYATFCKDSALEKIRGIAMKAIYHAKNTENKNFRFVWRSIISRNVKEKEHKPNGNVLLF